MRKGQRRQTVHEQVETTISSRVKHSIRASAADKRRHLGRRREGANILSMPRDRTRPILFENVFSRHGDSVWIVRVAWRQDLFDAFTERGLPRCHALLLTLDQFEPVCVVPERRYIRLVGAREFGTKRRIGSGRLARGLATIC